MTIGLSTLKKTSARKLEGFSGEGTYRCPVSEGEKLRDLRSKKRNVHLPGRKGSLLRESLMGKWYRSPV